MASSFELLNLQELVLLPNGSNLSAVKPKVEAEGVEGPRPELEVALLHAPGPVGVRDALAHDLKVF